MADKYTKLRWTVDEHKGRSAYGRIAVVVRGTGHLINHKTVERLMAPLPLKSLVRMKKYLAYKGELSRPA